MTRAILGDCRRREARGAMAMPCRAPQDRIGESSTRDINCARRSEVAGRAGALSKGEIRTAWHQ